MPKKKKIFYGWWIVIAAALLNFFAGGTFFYGFTVFFNPIRDTFRWGAAVTSVAFIFQRLERGILGPVAGFLVDRVGPRRLMLSGWSLVGLGFLLMSRTNSLWEFYASFILIAIGFSFGSLVVVNTVIVHWFTKKRSRAMAFVYVGYGASGTLVPLLALSINQFGWRTSLVVISIVIWVIGLSLSLVIRHKPEQYGYLPDGETAKVINKSTNEPNLHSSGEKVRQDSGLLATDFTAREAIRTRTFWLLAFTFFFQHIGTSAVMVHIVPYLESVNVPTAIGAIAVTGMTLSSLIGRIGFGFLGDFRNKRYLIAIALALQGIGLFIFSFIDVDRVWLIIPFLLIYGTGYGAPTPLRPALQADYFGIRSFGTIMGLMASISMIGGLASPVFAGWIFDLTGSYRFAWWVIALTTIPAIPLILLAKPPRAKQSIPSEG